MGGTQAANVLLTVRRDGLQARGKDMTEDEQQQFMQPILDKYEAEGNPYYSTARLWDDGILDPLDTRMALALGLSMSANAPVEPTKYGIFRM
jgi:acetyl-CoA carboxylase carboxyltransferase component